MDYYAVLDLDANCTDEEVKAQYRRLALQHHPDVNPGDEAGSTARLRTINEAYEVLSDPVKRRVYDLTVDKPTPQMSRPRPDASASPAPGAPAPAPPRVNPYTGAVADARRRAERRMAVAAVLAGAFLILFIARSSTHLTPIQVPDQLVSTPQDGGATQLVSPGPDVTHPPNNDDVVNSMQRALDEAQPQIDIIVDKAQEAARSSDPARDDNNRQAEFDRLNEEIAALRNARMVCQNDIVNAQALSPGTAQQAIAQYRADFQTMRTIAQDALRDIRDLRRARP